MTLRMSIKPGARCTAVRDSIHSLSAGRCERGSLIAGSILGIPPREETCATCRLYGKCRRADAPLSTRGVGSTITSKWYVSCLFPAFQSALGIFYPYILSLHQLPLRHRLTSRMTSKMDIDRPLDEVRLPRAPAAC